MAISYSKIGWDTTKYVNPTNMNHMDDGIKAACDAIDNDVLLKSGGTMTGELSIQNPNGASVISVGRLNGTGLIKYIDSTSGNFAQLRAGVLTADRDIVLPDGAGTLALADSFAPTELNITGDADNSYYIITKGHKSGKVANLCYYVAPERNIAASTWVTIGTLAAADRPKDDINGLIMMNSDGSAIIGLGVIAKATGVIKAYFNSPVPAYTYYGTFFTYVTA